MTEIMNMIQAINDAHRVMMRRDPDVVVYGEDVGWRGVFRAPPACRSSSARPAASTPNREAASSARRSAWPPMASSRHRDPVRRLYLSGLRPDRQRSRQDPLSHRRCGPCRWSSAPLWRRHLRRPDAQPVAGSLFTHIAGLKVVIPSTPYDAKGLLIAAIEDPDPVHLLRAQAHLQRPVRRPSRPAGDALVQASGERGAGRPLFGAARQGEGGARGEALTVLAYGTMVHVALGRGRGSKLDAEVIDLRTLVPLDIETIERR